MNSLEIKGSLFDLLWGVNDADTLLKIRAYVSDVIERAKEGETDWWEELTPAQQDKLERLIEDSKNGENLLTNEEAMKAIEAKFKSIRHAS